MLGLVVMCYECNQVYLEMKYNIGNVYSDAHRKKGSVFHQANCNTWQSWKRKVHQHLAPGHGEVKKA